MTLRVAALLLLFWAPAAVAQEPDPSPTPMPPEAGAETEQVPEGTPEEPAVEPIPEPTEPATRRPPGSFRVGRLLVTPKLRLHTIGVDTNVLDTANPDEDRRTDFIAIGGPAIELELPLRRTLTVTGEGHLDYVYYAKTPSQRRYVGGGSAGMAWDTGRTRFSVLATDKREYRRLDEELDRRVEQRERSIAAKLHRRILGRIGLRTNALLAARSLPDERDIGLSDVYDRTELVTLAGLDYALTFKTRLFVELERTESVFEEAGERDGRFEGVRGGVEADPSALISGRIAVGTRRLKLEQGGSSSPSFTYFEADPTLNISRRTRIGVFYRQDQQFSVLASSDLPIVESRRWGAHLYKDLLTRLELTARAERSEYTRSGGKDYRDESFAEILYRWRRLGIGFRAGYVHSPANAFIRSRAFESTIGGLVLRYR